MENFDVNVVWQHMTKGRYIQLSKVGTGLTDEERKNGWHFCANPWKGYLIHETDPTYKECECGHRENRTATESKENI